MINWAADGGEMTFLLDIGEKIVYSRIEEPVSFKK